jgi:hypothetical protein
VILYVCTTWRYIHVRVHVRRLCTYVLCCIRTAHCPALHIMNAVRNVNCRDRVLTKVILTPGGRLLLVVRSLSSSSSSSSPAIGVLAHSLHVSRHHHSTCKSVHSRYNHLKPGDGNGPPISLSHCCLSPCVHEDVY